MWQWEKKKIHNFLCLLRNPGWFAVFKAFKFTQLPSCSTKKKKSNPKTASVCRLTPPSVWGWRAWAAANLWLIAAHSWFDIRLANGGADADAATCAAYQINDVPRQNWLGTRIQRKSRRLKFNQHQEPLQQESYLRIDLPIWGVCRNTDEQVHLRACEKINNNIIRGGVVGEVRRGATSDLSAVLEKIPVRSKQTCISLSTTSFLFLSPPPWDNYRWRKCHESAMPFSWVIVGI